MHAEVVFVEVRNLRGGAAVHKNALISLGRAVGSKGRDGEIDSQINIEAIVFCKLEWGHLFMVVIACGRSRRVGPGGHCRFHCRFSLRGGFHCTVMGACVSVVPKQGEGCWSCGFVWRAKGDLVHVRCCKVNGLIVACSVIYGVGRAIRRLPVHRLCVRLVNEG